MTLCICTAGNLTSFFKYVTPLLLFFLKAFCYFKLKTLLSISCRIISDLYVPHISQNYCQWLIQIIFPVKFQSFQNKVEWWGETIWSKCPKILHENYNYKIVIFGSKQWGYIGGDQPIFWVVGDPHLSPQLPLTPPHPRTRGNPEKHTLEETLILLFYFFWTLFI